MRREWIKKLKHVALTFLMILLLSFPVVAADNDTAIEKQYFYEIPIKDSILFSDFEEGQTYFVQRIEELYENETMPEAVKEYINVILPDLIAKYNNDIAELKDKTEFSANDFKVIFVASQNYFFATYNKFVLVYNDYLKEKIKNSDKNWQLKNLLEHLLYFSYRENAYYHIPYDNILLDFEENHMIELYDRIYADLGETISDELERREKTFEIMKEAVVNWVEEFNIDYLTAYQRQVRQYLTTLQEMGYFVVRHEWYNYEYLSLDPNITKIRDVSLKDFGSSLGVPHFHLEEYFHLINLNEDQSDFLAPEKVFVRTEFQEYVENILSPINNLSDYDKDNVLNALHSTLKRQYSTFRVNDMPGSGQNPTGTLFYSYSFVHGIEGANLDLPLLTSWVLPETNLSPYDTYRSSNFLKVPYVKLREEVTKDVTRTIKYEFEDGAKAGDDVVQKVAFKGSKNLINEITTWENDELSLKALNNPKVTHSDQRVIVLESEDVVDEKKVTIDSDDSTITVIYPIEIEARVNYVDQNGKKLHDSKMIQGCYNEEYQVEPIAIEGYKLSSTPENATGVHKVGMKDITFVYQKDDEKDDSKLPIDNDSEDNKLPDTGNDITKILPLLALASMIGLGLYFKKIRS